MVNGLRINISESDFKAKPPADRDWDLYLAITKIDEYGCKWSASRYRESIWKKLTVIGAGVGGGIGFAFMIGKFFKCW